MIFNRPVPKHRFDAMLPYGDRQRRETVWIDPAVSGPEIREDICRTKNM